MESTEIAIVGGGVVGCALASQFSGLGRQVLLLEKENRIGDGVTSRNSGVVHSGLYYKPGSIKAETSIRGNALLYEWCEKHQVPFLKTGKLVLAKHAGEEAALVELHANAEASGAKGVQMVSASEIASLEPHVTGVAALWCKETGIVDAVAYARSLTTDAEERGALVVTSAEVTAITPTARGFDLSTARGDVRAERVVNAAGLWADQVAAWAGVKKYKIYPCRGDYFFLKSSISYQHLIYPVRKKHSSSLGIHLTQTLDGQYRLGPDFSYVESKDQFPAAEEKQQSFWEAAQRLLGPLELSQLRYDTCGIRPKLRAPTESEEKDFVVSEDLPGFMNLVGIESPGLTAAQALAEKVAENW